MRGLLPALDRIGKEHGMNLSLERQRLAGIAVSARQAVDFRLYLARMRRQQEDAAADRAG